MSLALMYPGQGAQYIGMGKDFYDRYPCAREMFNRAGEVTGLDFAELLFQGPESTLMQTQNLQPALTLINIVSSEVLLREISKIKIQYILGHSLGEISALYAAGCLNFDRTMELVMHRGRYMQECAENNPGLMLAILRLTSNELIDLIQESGLAVDIANYNAPGQIIVSGKKEVLAEFQNFLRSKEIKKIIPLKVSGPWHSRHMSAAQQHFAEYLESLQIKDARIPVISNITARPVTRGEELKHNIIHQITGSVRWTESIQYLASRGTTHFLECGPGNILSGLIKRIDKSLETHTINGCDDVIQLKNIFD